MVVCSHCCIIAISCWISSKSSPANIDKRNPVKTILNGFNGNPGALKCTQTPHRYCLLGCSNKDEVRCSNFSKTIFRWFLIVIIKLKMLYEFLKSWHHDVENERVNIESKCSFLNLDLRRCKNQMFNPFLNEHIVSIFNIISIIP